MLNRKSIAEGLILNFNFSLERNGEERNRRRDKDREIEKSFMEMTPG